MTLTSIFNRLLDENCYRFHHHIFVHLFLIRFHLFRFIFHFLFQNSKSETIFTHVRARPRSTFHVDLRFREKNDSVLFNEDDLKPSL